MIRLLVGAVMAAACVWAGTLLAQGTPRAYMVVQVDVTNPQQYAEYAKVAPGIVAAHGGRYLARAGRTVTLEGAAARARVVVLEFPSLAAAEAFYHSPQYSAARKLRAGAGEAQFVVVEGVE